MSSNKYKSTFRNAQPSARMPPGKHLKHNWVPMIEGWSFCSNCEARRELKLERFDFGSSVYTSGISGKIRWWITGIETFYSSEGEVLTSQPNCKFVPQPSPRKGFRT
jgi:hypothetical protein